MPITRLTTALLFATILAPASHAQVSCTCDCNDDGQVAIAELVTAVNISLEQADLSSCPAADADEDGSVAINELVQGVNAAFDGCGSITPSPVPTPTMAPDSQIPPLGDPAITMWLESGAYTAWAAESSAHPSGGPHFGDVRTFVNDALLASLEADNPAHPRGAAVVKELFGRDSSVVQGWAVSVKVDDDSADGDGWYWYERFGDSVFADSEGARICTGCHNQDSGSFTSRDLVLTPFPLQ